MIPRPPMCDDDRCDYDQTGRWVHTPGCWAVEEVEAVAWLDDTAAHMAAATAQEDGYGRAYGTAQPARPNTDRRAA